MKPFRPPPESEPSSLSPSRWYVVVDGQRLEPIMPGEVYTRIEQGVFTRSTLLWHRRKGYCALSETEFGTAFADVPPPAGMPSNRLVWVLAFAPLGMSLAIQLCAPWIRCGMAGTLAAVLAVNVALAAVDACRLARAGFDIRPMKPVWLPPVYLYRRSHALRQDLVHLGIWIASVAASLVLVPLID